MLNVYIPKRAGFRGALELLFTVGTLSTFPLGELCLQAPFPFLTVYLVFLPHHSGQLLSHPISSALPSTEEVMAL